MTTQNTYSTHQQQYDTLQHYDKMPIDIPWNDKDEIMDNVDFDNHSTMEKETQKVELMEEQKLSQEMRQLSTGTISDKELLVKEIKVAIKQIPNYLTKRNESFQKMIYQTLSTIAVTKSNDTDKTEELRKIAILIYKIMIIQTYHLLWTAYLKSGLGQLNIQSQKQLVVYPTNLPIWPKEIKTIVQSIKSDKAANEHEIYFNFVNDHLDELDHQLKIYQTELNIKANNFPGYTLTIQKMIETYIEENLQSFRMKIEHQIELIHYDYHIRALKLEYFRQKPNESQQQLMNQICQSKYEQETTEQELNLLKQQITYYNLPTQSFECSSIAHSPLLDSIQNSNIQQKLFKQYQEVAKQTRANIFTLYRTTAEEQRDEYKKKHDTNIKKMSNAYHSSIDNEKIDSIMLGLIHQRCQKISERIKCIYKFKYQYFLAISKP